MDKDTLADIAQEDKDLDDDDAFLGALSGDDEEENDTPTDSPTEENENGDDPTQEGEDSAEDKEDKEADDNTPDDKLEPFHKHPRWKQMMDKNQELTENVETLTGTLEGLQKQGQESTQTSVELPSWWRALAGDDDKSAEIYKGFLQQTKTDKETIRAELVKEQEAQVNKQQDEQTRWDEWVDLEVQNLKDEGLTFDKNELIQTAIKYQPSDEKGGISLRKALTILNMEKGQVDDKKKAKLDAKKKLAGDTTSTAGGEPSDIKTVDSGNLRRKSFHQLVQQKD